MAAHPEIVYVGATTGSFNLMASIICRDTAHLYRSATCECCSAHAEYLTAEGFDVSEPKTKKVAVSSLCIAAAVPATTALRWIKAMTDQRLFVREADPGDRRRVHIALSDDTARRMMACLAAMRRLAPMLI
jgi:hypothetical protein